MSDSGTAITPLFPPSAARKTPKGTPKVLTLGRNLEFQPQLQRGVRRGLCGSLKRYQFPSFSDDSFSDGIFGFRQAPKRTGDVQIES